MNQDATSIINYLNKNNKIINNPALDNLKNLAKKDEITTEYGSASYISKTRHRSKKFTEIIDLKNKNHEKLIENVLNFLKNKELITLDRTLGQNKETNLLCKTFITKNYARILHFWHKSLFDPDYNDKTQPDSLSIIIPEWPEIKVLIDPENQITYILGTDYFGECKKSHLRMAMYLMKKKGGLGLHAGSKILKITDEHTNLVEKGIILFGLSGTGKTTLTIHDHFLNDPERVFICQDDVVLMNQNTACLGTENNFYIKTEGLEPSQKILYKAAIQPEAILENIWVDQKTGQVDFNNYDLTTNGREIILQKDIPLCSENIDLPKTDIIVFITRHNDIVPPIAKLNATQAAAFFMLGESIETSAGDPSKAGKRKRVVGYNPFIIGSLAEEGNRFYQILKNNPEIECYLFNTGAIGNIDDITIKDSINILTEIAKDNIEWQNDTIWNYQIPVEVNNVETKKLNPANYFSEKEYNKLVSKLKEERINWLDQFEELAPETKIIFGQKTNYQ